MLLSIGNHKLKATTIRNSGSLYTIITKGLYITIMYAPSDPMVKDFPGLGAAASQRFIGMMNKLPIRFTPKVSVEYHATYDQTAIAYSPWVMIPLAGKRWRP